jgi:hypothetical protein
MESDILVVMEDIVIVKLALHRGTVIAEQAGLTRARAERRERGGIDRISERGAPFSISGFRRMVERATEAAGLEIKAHPHMLRYACGVATVRFPIIGVRCMRD